MTFEWDEAKAAANIKKYGISLESAYDFEFNSAIEFPDDDLAYGEQRHRAYGFIGPKLHVMVYVERGVNVRVISLRRATNKEKRAYEEAIEADW